MTVEINPLEAVIKLALADSALATATGSRIDSRNRYGQDTGDWALDAASLVVFPAAGQPYLDEAGVQNLQLEARCYADTYFEAGQVLAKLVDFTRHNERRTVTTSTGKALVYYVTMNQQPRQIIDEEARPNGGMPAYQVFLMARVAEQIVV